MNGGAAFKILTACDMPGAMTMVAGCAVSGGGAVGVGGEVVACGAAGAGDGADVEGDGRGESDGDGGASCAGAEPQVAATSASVKRAARLRILFVPNDIRTGGFANGTAHAQVLEVCQRFDQGEAALARRQIVKPRLVAAPG